MAVAERDAVIATVEAERDQLEAECINLRSALNFEAKKAGP
jgi:hypothetical protein